MKCEQVQKCSGEAVASVVRLMPKLAPGQRAPTWVPDPAAPPVAVCAAHKATLTTMLDRIRRRYRVAPL
jgi:hypothetical protein